MKLDVTPNEFNSYGNEKKKRYVAQLLIVSSKAQPVPSDENPIAFVMAGLPGAGKTEFLDSISEYIERKKINRFVRIDLDEIVGVYPDYSPKDYYKFRSQGNIVLARTIDEARHGRYNMMIDGTFSGVSGASVQTIDRLLKDGYMVNMVYMYDTAKSAWHYTEKRKLETGRAVDRKGFVTAARNLVKNIRDVVNKHRDNPNFSIDAVIQKELRDKEYYIITDKSEVDKIVELEYNTEA